MDAEGTLLRPIKTNATVRIDPTTLVDHPLSKERIAVYNSGLVPLERYKRHADFIAATFPESLRIDLGWGAEWMPWTREVVAEADDGSIKYDFDETDRIAELRDPALLVVLLRAEGRSRTGRRLAGDG